MRKAASSPRPDSAPHGDRRRIVRPSPPRPLVAIHHPRVDTPDISGYGAGTVVVAAPSADSLTFTESGDWQNSAGCTFRFHNIYRWSQIGPTSVRLEHQRRGAASAVHLLDLTVKSGSANRWISA